MSDFVEVMKHKERMCNTYVDCTKCPVAKGNNKKNTSCDDLMKFYPEEAQSIIMKWASAHPVKTNADKFKEVFGIEVDRGSHGCHGIGVNCCDIPCSECNYRNFWNKEYVDTKGDSNE